MKTWFYAYIIALLLSGPILNGSTNIKKGGQSLLCMKKATGEQMSLIHRKVTLPAGRCIIFSLKKNKNKILLTLALI